jgi:hypothetical protein
MNEMNVQRIIQNVMRDDENPPSTDYSILSYAAEVARDLDKGLLPALVTESFRQLPSSTAMSLLENVLNHVSVPSLKDVLLDVLPQGREVTSAGNVVRLLAERCQMRRFELAMRLIEGIRLAVEPRAQNNYAYGIFSTLGHGGRWGTGLPTTDVEAIQRALAEVPMANLTKYARETVGECIARA